MYNVVVPCVKCVPPITPPIKEIDSMICRLSGLLLCLLLLQACTPTQKQGGVFVHVNGPEGFAWIGHLDHMEYSQVTLVVEKDVLSGNITLPGSIYQIRYVGEGI